MTADGRVAAVLLAAGASSRLGEAKALLRTADGRALVRVLAERALAAGLSPVLVIVGETGTAARIAAMLDGSGATIVVNADWAAGMGTSIARGVSALAGDADSDALAPDAAGCVVLAVDQPAVTVAHLATLAEHLRTHDARAVSAYGGAVGIPAAWPARDFAALRALSGDRGAKALLRGDEFAVPLADGALDLDTPADVQAWRGGAGTNPAVGDSLPT